MAVHKNLDDEACVELLCCLVVTQLVGHARTGEWPRTNRVVGAVRVWLTSNAAGCDWFERLALMRMSAGTARQFLVFPYFGTKRHSPNSSPRGAAGLSVAGRARHP